MTVRQGISIEVDVEKEKDASLACRKMHFRIC